MHLNTVCVYCGSSPGADPAYSAAARTVGRLLGESGRTLVYGGGHIGLMGAVADAALATGGRVIGVIPRALEEKELAHGGLTDLRVVGSMHERKSIMAEFADGFLALPGGLGTLEELFETWTWGQLGLHAKPYGLLNVAGFYDPLLTLVDHMVHERFVGPEHRAMLLVDTDPEVLLQRMESHRARLQTQWIHDDET
jgi:uncharacterized protein (TIGR00730 family)